MSDEKSPTLAPDIQDKIARGELVYFAAAVPRQRAEHLARALDEPLCTGCGREEAECSADPCQDVLADRGAPKCSVCGRYEMAGHLNVPGECEACQARRRTRTLELAVEQVEQLDERIERIGESLERVEIITGRDGSIGTPCVHDPRDDELNGAWVHAWFFVDFRDTDLDSGNRS